MATSTKPSTDDETAADTATSELADDMRNAGASPQEIDAQALLAQIQQLQQQMIELRAAQGIPGDPVEAGMRNLLDHIIVRADAHPAEDFSDIIGYELDDLGRRVRALRDMPKSNPSSKDTDAFRTVLAEWVKAHPRVENADYLVSLANNLHLAVLKK